MSTDPSKASDVKACPTCGLVQCVPSLSDSQRARCIRCRAIVLCGSRLADGNQRTIAAALAALLLYPLAIGLPIMRLEQLGHSTEASVFGGSVGLLEHGELLVGGLVFVCSVLLPFIKLVVLLWLCSSQRLAARHRASFYHAIEAAGRWGMLDVLLVAVIVAWVKIGDLVEVTAGPGALAFGVMVVLSLMASASFDSHSLWRRADEIQ
ncbi:MAG: paraquat-inducible protein A [Candidatus Paceibacteria bacterium]|jgi:paraquat-inducible protein A